MLDDPKFIAWREQSRRLQKKVIHHEKNTRVPCICSVRTANMIYNGYIIGEISEEKNDAGESDWVIKMDWENWWLSGRPRVAGIDLDLGLDEYIRSYIPGFVEQRTLPDNRDGLQDELAQVGLMYNDRFEFMCRTKKCGPSRITVERKNNNNKI